MKKYQITIQLEGPSDDDVVIAARGLVYHLGADYPGTTLVRIAKEALYFVDLNLEAVVTP